MRSADEETQRALDAGERTYGATLRLGGREVPVTSWTLDRGLETGLPDAIASPMGTSSAQLKADVQGESDQTAAERYSPWAPRLTADVTRPGQSTTFAWGLAGAEDQAFRGRVRSVSASAADGAVDIECLDGAELLRGAASLPPHAESTNFTGRITPVWPVTHALRQGGIHMTPPPRTGDGASPVFFASLSGAFAADMGMMIQYLGGHTRWSRDGSPWGYGPHGGPNAWEVRWAPQRRVISTGNTVLIEFWMHRDDAGDTDTRTTTLQYARGPQSDGDGASSSPELTCTVMAVPGWYLRLHLTSSDYFDLPWPESSPEKGRFKAAAEIYIPGASSPVRLRAALYDPDGAVHTSEWYTSSTTTPLAWLHNIRASSPRPMECINVTRIPNGSSWDIVTPWRQSAVINATPNYSNLTNNRSQSVMPNGGGSWWGLLKEIAESFLAYMHFDEDGVFHFDSYDYIRWGSNPDPDVTVTSRREIGQISTSQEIDSLANRVGVGWQHPSVSAVGAQTYHHEPWTQLIPAGSSAEVNLREANITRPYRLTCPMPYTTTTPPDPGPSQVQFLTVDGYLARVEPELTWDGDSPRVYYHNMSDEGARAIMASDNNEGSLVLSWASVGLQSRAPATMRTDTDSVAIYGEQTLEISASSWVQNAAGSDNRAQEILRWTAHPVPLTSSVDVLPDPRVQLGDVVRIQEPTGVLIDGLFRVVGTSVSGSNSSVSMQLTVRPLYRPQAPADSGLTMEPVPDPDVVEEFLG